MPSLHHKHQEAQVRARWNPKSFCNGIDGRCPTDCRERVRWKRMARRLALAWRNCVDAFVLFRGAFLSLFLTFCSTWHPLISHTMIEKISHAHVSHSSVLSCTYACRKPSLNCVPRARVCWWSWTLTAPCCRWAGSASLKIADTARLNK